MRIYAHSHVGYSHNKAKKPCQDYSCAFQDLQRAIVVSCDGHGGEAYIRSERGARFAGRALMKVFLDLTRRDFWGDPKDLMRQIKLAILCEWNRLVEKDLSDYPVHKRDLEGLSEDAVEKLKDNPYRVYGTTLIGAMSFAGRIIIVHLGDGESMVVRRGESLPAFEEDEEEPVANVTYSLCQEDAYDHMKLAILDEAGVDAVLLCSDGVVNPYSNYGNFQANFVRPMLHRLLEEKTGEVDDFLDLLGAEKGIGDDVSLSVLLFPRAKEAHYRD